MSANSFFLCQPTPLLSWLIFTFLLIHKNVEPVLLPVPRCKGSRIALLVETSNVESPTPMLCIIHALLLLSFINNKTQQGLYIKTSQGAFPLLCSWLTVWTCEILTSSKPKRSVNALCIMSRPSAPSEMALAWGRQCKVSEFTSESYFYIHFFAWRQQ